MSDESHRDAFQIRKEFNPKYYLPGMFSVLYSSSDSIPNLCVKCTAAIVNAFVNTSTTHPCITLSYLSALDGCMLGIHPQLLSLHLLYSRNKDLQMLVNTKKDTKVLE